MLVSHERSRLSYPFRSLSCHTQKPNVKISVLFEYTWNYVKMPEKRRFGVHTYHVCLYKYGKHVNKWWRQVRSSKCAALGLLCRTQWPSGLRRGSSADRSPRLRVRIPSEAWMFVLCAVSKDKKAKCRTIKTKTQVRMTYKEYNRIQKKKKIQQGTWIFVSRVCLSAR